MEQGFGAFGKMPALGDFFHINAPSGFMRVWDDWLQGAMMTGAQAGGDRWDAQYMSAPIWRFTLAPGLAGAAKVMGVLMPSVDRVGRRFPLSLMASVPDDAPASLDHLTHDETFDALEDVALAALEDGMDRDRLGELLGQINTGAKKDCAPLRRAGQTIVLNGADGSSPAPELAAGLIGAGGISAPSLWTALIEDKGHTMICDGLPGTHEARALFDLNAPLWMDARVPA
ncbi:Type VI secretion-associated protein, BMA A0400 family [Sulfitobacter noctilucicola]|uniref:Type VI secretion system protein ImpM n=1 Tax=Sulfitobacter noctilucicola TaxID=1342301 RepID=A0A7W6MBT6_9RHOB|nr:type VI secretion system-associated protein TagF [Sulfitobacter noctilucicola]KIN69984.1 Type VI secretion-associated protein, BMA A0400 family [Sulfitobacter noctilucicola]MBB4175996.1 type VI secretion system protein ImpM [Sulfitobacter noctilucicola]